MCSALDGFGAAPSFRVIKADDSMYSNIISETGETDEVSTYRPLSLDGSHSTLPVVDRL